MKDVGGLVLLGVGMSMRYGITDPDVPNFFVVAALFVSIGVLRIGADVWAFVRA